MHPKEKYNLSWLPHVCILILNFNGKQDTLECLESVRKIDYPNFNAIVVDNASTDGSVEDFKSAFPQTSYIENKQNLGFAAGNNVGIRHGLDSGAEYIFVLNNDTVVDPNILTCLVSVYPTLPLAGFVGCKICFYDNPKRIQYFGGLIEKTPILRGYHPEEGFVDNGSLKAVKETQYITGCAMFASSEVWKKTGGFDEKFFMYWEDSDLGLRAASLGYKNYVVPEAVVFHKVGSSTDGGKNLQAKFYGTRNRIYFANKHDIKFDAFKVSTRQIITLLKTKWELRFTAAVGEALAYLCAKLNKMGKAPRAVETILDSQIEKEARLNLIRLKHYLRYD